MAESIIYPAADNRIIIVSLLAGADSAAAVARVVPAETNYKVVVTANIPAVPYALYDCRYYDDADSFGISNNLTVARATQVNRWRQARAPLLPPLDILYLRAIEDDDSGAKASIAATKNTLRNVTTTDLSGATTLTAIGAIWPACLGSNPYSA